MITKMSAKYTMYQYFDYVKKRMQTSNEKSCDKESSNKKVLSSPQKKHEIIQKIYLWTNQDN